MPSDSPCDKQLMRDLLRDAPGALELIIEKWQRPLYSFVYRYTQNEFATRDILQETFVRVYTKREKYEFNYPLSSWVFTIAANLCKNQSRWRKRHPETSLENLPSKEGSGERLSLLDSIASEDDLPAAKIEHDEDLDTLKEAVASLPHDLRAAVLLHHYQDLSYKEISKVVGCSVRGVETRLYRARKALRGRVEELRTLEGSAQKKTVQPEAGTVRGCFAKA